MQRVERGAEPPPQILASRAANEARAALRSHFAFEEVRRRQTSVPRTVLNLGQDAGLMEALGRLFHGRCAFCEAQVPVQPYHFRPVRDAAPRQGGNDDHLYYAWLETAWENIYPICAVCLPAEPHYFPVEGSRCRLPTTEELTSFANDGIGLWRAYPLREKSQLLDPCVHRDFYRSIKPRVDGVLLPASPRGEATIKHFNLGSQERSAMRGQMFARSYGSLTDALSVKTERRLSSSLFRFQEMEFGGSWYGLLRRIATVIAKGNEKLPVLSQARIEQFFAAMYGRATTRERLERAWSIVAAQDDTSAPAVVKSTRVRRPIPDSFKSVRLTNFKAIESLSIALPESSQSSVIEDAVEPVPSIMILGENAAGKSSILEAIALVMSDEAARKKVGAEQAWVLNPTYLGAAKTSRREMATVDVELSNGATRCLSIRAEAMAVEDRGEWNAPPILAYGAFRQFKKAKAVRGPDQHIRNLFTGAELANPESWLLQLDDLKFDMVIRALREILSIEGEFDVVERDESRRSCQIVTSVPGSGERTRTPMKAVSSGFRSVLAMACDVMHGLMNPLVHPYFESLATAHGIVLIDEIEAHLHPRWKMQIMSGLRRALPKVTFIATSHDPLCLRGMRPGEVFVLQRVAGGQATQVTELPVVVERLQNLPDISMLRVEQLLTSDFFQMQSTDEPELDRNLAQIADILARDPSDLRQEELLALRSFQDDLSSSLPIGSSEAHRIVQEAVAEYLQQRRSANTDKINSLRTEAKSRIVSALRGEASAQG